MANRGCEMTSENQGNLLTVKRFTSIARVLRLDCLCLPCLLKVCGLESLADILGGVGRPEIFKAADTGE
jgi:hypothetical protein